MITQDGKLAIAASGFPGLTLPKMDVFSNDFVPTELSVWADFVIPTYTGYTSPAAALSPVYLTAAGEVSSDPANGVFLGPTAGAGSNVFGWVLSDGTTHAVWAAGRFDATPLFLQNPLARLEVDLTLHLDGSDEARVDN